MILNLKYLKFAFLIYLICIFTLLFSSCNENPVTTKKLNPIDTNDLFSWKYVNISGEMTELFVIDSNNVWINGVTVPLFYNGTNIQVVNINDPNFAFRSLGFFDKNNVFFGGGIWPVASNSILKKWTNGIISTYFIPNDTGWHVSSILPTGQNQAWLSSDNMNKIYFFSSGNFTSYNLDSGVIGSYFFEDINNNLYLFGYNHSVTVQYSYKLINDSMHLITWDTLGLSRGKSSFLVKCNKDILMLGNPYSGSNSLLIFNGQNWIHYMDTDFGIFKLGGSSKDSLFAIELSGFIHVWENNKWIKSDSVLFPWYVQGYNFGDVILKDSKLFFTVNFDGGGSYLFIGTRKNQNK